jgi:hypothetical protein
MAKDHQPHKRQVAPAPSMPKKKPYRAPRLVEYGDLRTITQAKGGNMDDGTGVAATKK